MENSLRPEVQKLEILSTYFLPYSTIHMFKNYMKNENMCPNFTRFKVYSLQLGCEKLLT